MDKSEQSLGSIALIEMPTMVSGTSHPNSAAPQKILSHSRRTQAAVYLVCLGVLMIALDTTIVTVALPSIIADLHLSGTSLTWLLNAYLLSLGGFLLLGGRLGDLYGQRRVFLLSVAAFALASLLCGLVHSFLGFLIGRAVQGIGGAIVSAVSLSLIMNLCGDTAERAKAVAIYGFICAAGGAVGELVGGLLTATLNWRWIFLVNLPVGVAVCALCPVLLPRDPPTQGSTQLDIAGAVTGSIASSLVVYVLGNLGGTGSNSPVMRGLVVLIVALLLFFAIETRVGNPLIPLRLFSSREFATANAVALLWAAAEYAWFVICALYLQRVLHYDSLQIGLSFLPATCVIAILCVGLSTKCVRHFGMREPLWVGLLLFALGLALLARTPPDPTFIMDVLPAMLLLGLGSGMASTPLFMSAMCDVHEKDSGVASGIVNMSFLLGGSLGLALLAGLADAHTRALQSAGWETVRAANAGYRIAFLGGAILCTVASCLAALLVRPRVRNERTNERALSVRTQDSTST
jgi:EmrB/QacA subfamily drug resistance transporter